MNVTRSFKQGENLAFSWGRGTDFDYAQLAADSWYNEVVKGEYNFATGKSDNNGVVGHFTQMVWDTSIQLGCAKAYREYVFY